MFLHVIGAAALLIETGPAANDDLSAARLLVSELCYTNSGGRWAVGSGSAWQAAQGSSGAAAAAEVPNCLLMQVTCLSAPTAWPSRHSAARAKR